ncbi:MAG: hypothetical protein H6Q38_2424 [Chloroflexi bacterium]|jgi:hypothetical protein|nr:hypothetical protein [Chloroflexota bacterium]
MQTNRLYKILWISLVLVLALALVATSAMAKGKPDKDKPNKDKGGPPIFLSHPQTNGNSGPAQPLTPGGRPLYAQLQFISPSTTPTMTEQTSSGMFKLRLNQGQESICFEFVGTETFTPTQVMTGTLATIYWGDPDSEEENPSVVTIPVQEDGASMGCVTASKELIKDIRKNPDQYYVSLQSADLNGGEMSGQLSKWKWKR